MRRYVFLFMLLVLIPATASAKPNDADQTFRGTAQGSFSGPDWQLVPGTQARFVAPGRYGAVDLVLDFGLEGTCADLTCELAVFQDGVPVVSEEGGLGGEGLGFAEPGRHRLQLAVRGTVEVDGVWTIHLQQVR